MAAELKAVSAVGLECSECGATAQATCGCGVAYVPAGTRAAAAVAANPKKSDRALAAELGVSGQTIGRARKKSGATNVAPERVAGKDGKSYPARRTPRQTLPFDPNAAGEDYLTPSHADRTIKTTVRCLGSILFNPPPGIRACLKEAMRRASAGDIEVITLAAEFLNELKGSQTSACSVRGRIETKDYPAMV